MRLHPYFRKLIFSNNLTMGNKASHFSKTVDTLPGLTLDEKAKARVLYGTRPGFAEHADVFISGNREVAARSIKLLVAGDF